MHVDILSTPKLYMYTNNLSGAYSNNNRPDNLQIISYIAPRVRKRICPHYKKCVLIQQGNHSFKFPSMNQNSSPLKHVMRWYQDV